MTTEYRTINISLPVSDLRRIVAKFAQGADFTEERDQRIHDALFTSLTEKPKEDDGWHAFPAPPNARVMAAVWMDGSDDGEIEGCWYDSEEGTDSSGLTYGEPEARLWCLIPETPSLETRPPEGLKPVSEFRKEHRAAKP